MNNVDKRNKLQEKHFTFRGIKDGKVLIDWHNKQAMILKGETARKFLESISKMNPEEAQLLMARATGHFKHGNER